MKKFFLLIVIAAAFWQVCFAEGDVVWQKFIEGSGNGGRAVKFTPDGKHIIVGCKPNIFILKTENGEIEKTLSGHTGTVTRLAISPDGTQLATGSEGGGKDGRVILWDLTTGKSIHVFSDLKELPPVFGELSETSGLEFTPDGNYLIGTSVNKDYKNLVIWKTSDYSIYQIYDCIGSNQYMGMSYDGQYIAISNYIRSFDNLKQFRVIIWKIGEDKPLKTINIQSEGGGLDDGIGKVEYSKDGKYLLVVCSKSVTILNTSDYSVKNVIRVGGTATFFPSAPVIVVGLTAYDINTLKVLHNFSIGYGNDEDIDFESKYLVVAGLGNVQLYSLGIVGVKENPIEPYQLKLNVFPNPVNKELNISFNLPTPSNIDICIYSLTGTLIKKVVIHDMSEGQNQLIENVKYISSGTYICKIQAGNLSESIHFMINK